MIEQPNVLVIEENRDLSDAFSLILKKRGYNVQTVKEATTAVNRPDRSSFDVILMDVKQQGKDEAETVSRIKKLAPGARVILMASHYSDDELRNYLVEQVFQTVYKPVDIGQLMNLIKEAVENQPIFGNGKNSAK